jgi:hypothetical protein
MTADDHDPLDAGRFLDGALARIKYRCVCLWLHRWRGAGFVPRLDGTTIHLPKAWADQFPDGPPLIDMLRAEFAAVIRHGFPAAVAADPRLRVPAEQAYRDYARGLHDDTDRRLAVSERLVQAPRDEADKAHLHELIGKLKAEKTEMARRLADAERQVQALRRKAVPA